MKTLLSFYTFLPLFLSLFYPSGSFASNEFQDWMAQEQQSFIQYRDERDREFSSYLKNQWQEMQVFQGLVRDKTPKPDKIPVAQPAFTSVPAEPVITIPATISKPDDEPVIRAVPAISDSDKQFEGELVEIFFYGHTIQFYYDPSLKHTIPSTLNKTTISSAWSKMSLADYDSLNQQLNLQRASLLLNDWSYALLLYNISHSLHRDRNSQLIFIWFFMTKAGYQARIAYDQTSLYLLLPTRQQLFSTPYFAFDNTRFYAISFTADNKLLPTKIYTYNGTYPDATRKLDMRVKQSLVTTTKPSQRKLTFTYNNKTYSVMINYDKHLINYLSTYPQMDISIYFQSRLHTVTANPLLKQLRTMTKDMSKIEAVNFLLRFVQTAFSYKTDIQQFGVENYLFPEETLYYPSSDCEDRSVLFSWLVGNLLDLEVIGLDYPGHISAAIHFSNELDGDFVTYNTKKFMITDPTYVNASAGMSMPQYKNITPEVIVIQ